MFGWSPRDTHVSASVTNRSRPAALVNSSGRGHLTARSMPHARCRTR